MTTVLSKQVLEGQSFKEIHFIGCLLSNCILINCKVEMCALYKCYAEELLVIGSTLKDCVGVTPYVKETK